MKDHPNVKVLGNIIVQYGGGNMMKPGSYDRYTPFKNNPEADFIVIAWPLGLVQASCNPFKKTRALKGIDLGEIKDEVLSKWETQLKSKEVPLSTIKWVSETGVKDNSVGFTFKDFVAIYGKDYRHKDNGRGELTKIGKLMEKPYYDLTKEEIKFLDNVEVNGWDLLDRVTLNTWQIIKANSGGHKCITNISGLNYLGRSNRPPQNTGSYRKEPGDETAYVKFTKMIQNEFVRVLQEKIRKEQ
jgi:hypothetical protein